MTSLLSAQERKLLRNVVIPLRPDVLQRFTDEIKQPEPDLDSVIFLIQKDLSLSAAVLKVANSAAFRRSKPFTSIKQAVMVLGLTRIEAIVNSVALRHSLGQSKELETFWQHSAMIADLMTVICELQEQRALQDPAYMLGLFHASGIPVLLNNFDDYPRFMLLAERKGWSEVLGNEKVYFGVTHTAVSAILASRWKIPKALVEVIFHLHDEKIFQQPRVNPLVIKLLCYLKIARNVMHQRTGGDYDTPEWMKAEFNVLRSLKLKNSELAHLRDQINETYQLRLDASH